MRFLLLVLTLLLGGERLAFGADYYVDTDAGNNSNNGTSWALAKKNLDNALVAAPNPLTSATVIHVRGATADTTSVPQRPHGTTSTNTLTIQTDPADRNTTGVWDDTKYHLVLTNGTFSVADQYESVYGLQIKSISNNFQGAHAISVKVTMTAPGTVNLAYNILVGQHGSDGSGASTDAAAIHTGTTNLPVNIWNNVMYNWIDTIRPSVTTVLCVSAYGTTSLFNNTCYNSRQGFYIGTTVPGCQNGALVRNNIFVSVVQPLTSGNSSCSFAAGTDYNATDGSALLIFPAAVSGGDGTHEQVNVSTTGLFANAAGGDFHLTSSSSLQVRGAGMTDPGSGLFSDDIQALARTVPWDIGAFKGPPSSTTHWVSPTGTATVWANCDFASAPASGADSQHCTLATANTNAAAGDIVYLRGGSYSVNVASLAGAISPTNSGSGAFTRIIFSAAPGETPILTNANPRANRYGVLLTGDSYIKISGITFVDWDRWASIQTLSHHNEIANCEFYLTTGYMNAITSFSQQGIFIQSAPNPVANSGSTHNWIHGNKLHDLAAPVTVAQAGGDPCECGDILRIGSANANDGDSDNNTVENNIFYHAGHTLTDNFGHKNVWRNNVGHQEGFKTGQTAITGIATGGSTTTLIDTSKDFNALGVTTKTWQWIHDMDAANSVGQLFAKVTSISTTTNANDTLNFTSGLNSPTFTGGGHHYSITSQYTPYPAYPSSSQYAHRNFEMDSVARDGAIDNQLFEGNRGGHSSPNANNDGHEGLSLTTGASIVRYNFFFDNSASGLYFKNGNASSNNTAYNNTMYHNGRYAGIQHATAPVVLAGTRIPLSTTVNAKIKNNLMYDNPSDVVGSGGTGTEWAFNWCTGGGTNGCVGTANPLFTNPDVSDPMSTTLPDLSVQLGSPVIDAGGPLTTAVGSGSASTSLVVNWARYFQDGTWGSDLAKPAAGLGGTFVADWIAIGTVTNTVQITAVNYSTNTITLASAMTWADGANVWLYKKSDGAVVLNGAAPDIGAFESTPLVVPASTMTAGSITRAGAVSTF